MKIFFKENAPKRKKIVVISPHPDDMAISVGGTISILSEKNKVYNFVMTTGYRGVEGNKPKIEKIKIREKECMEECKILKVNQLFLRLDFYDRRIFSIRDVKKVSDELSKIKPKIIILPHRKDLHPTHKTSVEILKRALQNYRGNIDLWEYESLWRLFANNEYNLSFYFPESIMEKKLKAILAHKSQIKRNRYDVAAKSLSALRSVIVAEQGIGGYGKKKRLPPYAEVFRKSKLQEFLGVSFF